VSGPRQRQPRWGKDAEKYLLRDEPPVIATRRHPAVLVRPFLRGVPALVVGVWFLQLDPDNRVSTTLGLLVVLGALVYLGLHLLDNAMLDELATECRRHERSEFLFSVMPLAMPGATGSPVNPLAIF